MKFSVFRLCKRPLSRLIDRRRNVFPLEISEEVRQALNDKYPVVSLESTIVTHGLPYPQNLIMARQVEQEIRNHGGIPATCAFIGGKPIVGLCSNQLEYLAEQSKIHKAIKISRRDIGYSMAHQLNGGTTIALTMILSNLAGIRVFATGGLGGVHKDGHITMDVSADLTELGRTPVSVVCSGPKSILDITLTMEYLETQGVFIGTFNDGQDIVQKEGIDVPGFYCRSSGVKSPYIFHNFSEAARIIHNQNEVMGLESGNVFCIPPSKDIALPSDVINTVIADAIEEAKAGNVIGKELTPFLLNKIAAHTKGKSVDCNIKFVLNNAKSATKIAKELVSLNKSENKEEERSKHAQFPDVSIQNFRGSSKKIIDVRKADLAVVGSIAVDSIAKTFSQAMKLKDSNPGRIVTSIGGVAFNIFTSCLYYLSPKDSENYSDYGIKLISAVANDINGQTILKYFEDEGLEESGILTLNDKMHLTSSYLSIHDGSGNLIAACSDMKIIEDSALLSHTLKQLIDARPLIVVLDCNLSANALEQIMELLSKNLPSSKVIVEPTSGAKARRLAEIPLTTFPNHKIDLISPTKEEIEALYSSFNEAAFFEDYDKWFPIIDSLGIDIKFRDRLSSLSQKKYPILKDWLKRGLLQQAFQLLPYFPNITLKLGHKGILYLGICTNVNSFSSVPTVSPYVPHFTITSRGKSYIHENELKTMGVILQYFPIPLENKDIEIVNVTGAGDSFIGTLSAKILQAQRAFGTESWLDSEITSPEQEWNKWESIYAAQISSGLSLKSEQAVSKEIRNLEV